MNISLTETKFDEKNMWLAMSDDRILGVPLVLLQLLLNLHLSSLHIYLDDNNSQYPFKV